MLFLFFFAPWDRETSHNYLLKHGFSYILHSCICGFVSNTKWCQRALGNYSSPKSSWQVDFIWGQSVTCLTLIHGWMRRQHVWIMAARDESVDFRGKACSLFCQLERALSGVKPTKQWNKKKKNQGPTLCVQNRCSNSIIIYQHSFFPWVGCGNINM